MIMQDFDVIDVKSSMRALLLAAEEVENMNMEHPPGFHAGRTTKSTIRLFHKFALLVRSPPLLMVFHRSKHN